MKFKDLINLLEANLYNKPDLINSIKELLNDKNVNKPQIKDWFNKQLVNWFISSTDDDKKPIKPYKAKDNDPDWAKKPDVVYFDGFNSQQIENYNHIIDYFNSVDDNELNKIYKQPYEIILKKVEEWDISLKNQKIDESDRLVENIDYKVELKFDDGVKYVKLISEKGYITEGKLMGHCVGGAGYWESHTQGELDIYSLIDSFNKPHATLEVQNVDEVKQIKGKGNKAPIPKYTPYIITFIEYKKFKVIEDGENIGFVKWKDIFYNPKSDKFIKLYNSEILPLQNKTIEAIYKEARENNGKVKKININNMVFFKLPDFKDIQVIGNFWCSNNQLTSLQGAPSKVGYNFDCSRNQLTSLQGAPTIVGGEFSCYNNQLTSLQGAPSVVGGFYWCSNNQLTSLQGAPSVVNGDFTCYGNQLTSLQGAPSEVGRSLNCSYNKLTSLQGAPSKVGSNFSCNDNKLTSLQGASSIVGGFLNCSNNQLTTLQGAPSEVGGSFYCSSNQLTSLQGAPSKVGGGFLCNNNKLTSLQGVPSEIFGFLNCKDNPGNFTDADIKKAMQASIETFKEYVNKLGTVV